MSTGTPAGRIPRMRYCTAMVTPDTVDYIAVRVLNLLNDRRRMTVLRSYPDRGGIPDVKAGLTVTSEGPKVWQHHGAAGIAVNLEPGLAGFGLATYGEDATEAAAWARLRSTAGRDKSDLTEVTINGGLPGDGPARDDHLIIRAWNSNGVCIQTVVAFDYDTGRTAERMRAEEEAYAAALVDPDPMPVFVIKGKDRLAPAAVRAYIALCVDNGLSVQAAEVGQAVEEIIAWQERNPGKVKTPDHPHVPARPETTDAAR